MQPLALVPSRRIMLLQILAGAAMFIAAVLAQGYELGWDTLNYHYYNGWAALHHKIWQNTQVSMRQSYFFPLMDAGFAWLVASVPPLAVAAVLAIVQSALYPLLLMLAWALLGGTGSGILPFSMVAAVLGVLAPVNIWEAGSAFGDTTSAVPVVLALLLTVLGLQARDQNAHWRYTLAAGALCGIAVALKLTNAPFAIGFLAAVAAGAGWQSYNAGRKRTLMPVVTGCIGVLLGFGVLYGPWGVTLFEHFHNPFFPYFNQYFRSPFAPPNSFQDPGFLLPTLSAKLLFPFTRNPATAHDDFAGLFDLRMAVTLPLVIVALPKLLIYRQSKQADAEDGAAFTLLVFFLVSYAVWLSVFAINRYLVVLDLLAPTLCMVCLTKYGGGRDWTWLGVVVFSSTVLVSAYAAHDMIVRPFDHRDQDSSGYFGVQVPMPPDLERGDGLVTILGDEGLAFMIPFFPKHTAFVRLGGSLYYPKPSFLASSRTDNPELRQATFDDSMSKLICSRLDTHKGPLFTLRQAGGPGPGGLAAAKYFGVQELPGQCAEVKSKAPFGVWLCRAVRNDHPECDASHGL